MKTLMSCLLGLAVVALFIATPQKAEAGDCFNQFQVQRVVVPQRQQVVVQQRFVRQPVFQRQRFVQRQRIVGSGSTLRNLSLIGVFGRDVQRFSAVGTGLGF